MGFVTETTSQTPVARVFDSFWGPEHAYAQEIRRQWVSISKISNILGIQFSPYLGSSDTKDSECTTIMFRH